MTRPVASRNPLEGVTQLLVDGTNLLHAMTRGPDRQPPDPGRGNPHDVAL